MKRFAGIVVALLEEARCLGDIPAKIGSTTTLEDGSRVHLSGMGPQRATAAAQALLADGATALISWGTCGALQPGLKAGALLLPMTVMDDAGVAYPIDPLWRSWLEQALPSQIKARGGLLLSGARPVTTRRAKASSHAATAAVAVDMESAAVAAVAAAANVPFLVLRVVVDDADQSLPSAALSAVDEIGQPQTWPLLRSLATRPLQLRQLMALGRGLAAARKTLCAVAACAPGPLAFVAADPA